MKKKNEKITRLESSTQPPSGTSNKHGNIKLLSLTSESLAVNC